MVDRVATQEFSMQDQDLAAPGNPFALMIDPKSVIAAVERSERLARLHSTICRPLDKVKLEGATIAERNEFYGVAAANAAEIAAEASAERTANTEETPPDLAA